ncbi:hypothetical protein SAY87_001777 [Trapa incisa]|uniref:Uncharacterized protein n=1 Tax=Trapa incisa TaxID=236973 RepID=A0AAN7JT52_9MYRT|nr:hypothetical protein SAY87_001777 [Trapa incisa]
METDLSYNYSVPLLPEVEWQRHGPLFMEEVERQILASLYPMSGVNECSENMYINLMSLWDLPSLNRQFCQG